MPHKKALYRINEEMLRNTLLGYSVAPDPSLCSAIEQDVAGLRMQKTFKLPDTKVLVRFVALPVLLVAAGLLVYFNMDVLRNAFTPAEVPGKAVNETKVVISPVVDTHTTMAVNNTPPPVVNNVAPKQDTLVTSETKKADTVKEQIVKQASPVLAAPPTDSVLSGLKKEKSIVKSEKVDSADSKKTDQPVKKKKKRRKRSDTYIEDVKESSLKPSAADDDIVVPQ